MSKTEYAIHPAEKIVANNKHIIVLTQLTLKYRLSSTIPNTIHNSDILIYLFKLIRFFNPSNVNSSLNLYP